MRGFTTLAILVAGSVLLASLTAKTSNAANTDNGLALGDIQAQLHGAKGDVLVTFSWNDKHKYATLRQEHSGVVIVCSLVPLQNEKTGAIDLRLDYKNSEGKHSAIIATVKRNASGDLMLSVLAKAVEIDSDYRAVEDVVIRVIKKV